MPQALTEEEDVGESSPSINLQADNRTIVAGDASGGVHFLQLIEADETKPPIGETETVLLNRKEQGAETSG
jgi:hypothetical protein